MKRFVLVSCFLLAQSLIASTQGADLPAGATTALDKAGIPVIPGTVFCIGTPQAGLRFATKQEPESVRRWYRDKLSSWSSFIDEDMDIWVLYDGPPDLRSFAAVVAFNHVTVQENANLPEWHDLSPDTTTEIVIMATQVAAPDTDGALAVIPPFDGWKVPNLPTLDTADLEGSIHHTQDMESESERYYFYLQDEDYNEFLIAFEDELPEPVVARLEALADTDRPVRVLGNLFVDEDMGRACFDRRQALRIVAAD